MPEPNPTVPASETPEARCPFHAGPEDRFPLPRQHPFHPPGQYAERGREAPIRQVLQWNGSPAWFVTSYALVKALLMDARTSADATHPSYPAQSPALVLARRDYQAFAQMDPPEHTVERKLLTPEFSAKRVEEMRPKVQAIADRLIDRMMAAGDAADLVRDYAAPLPCQVICTLLGVPESDHAALQGWSAEISSRSTAPERAAAMIREFCDGYLTTLVRRKNAQPEDDLLSRLIVEQMRPGHLSELKVVSLARLFLTAGHESTTGTLGVGLATLLYHPDQLERLRCEPELIGSAVEEILRFTDVTHAGRLRIAKEDIEIGGVTIRAGDAIIMHQATANREAAIFADPHRFDISRNPRQHLAFGMGIHRCIGQPLARMELAVAFNTIVQRLPAMRPTETLEALDFHHGMAIYGLRALPVRLGTLAAI